MISDELQRCMDCLNQEIDDDDYEDREDGLDELTLENETLRFKKRIGHGLDDTYLALMAKSNGVMFNGMKIFPLSKHAHQDETIVIANEDMHEHLSEDYIFYGNFDAELYGYHIETGEYHAIEYSCDSVWDKFISADAMFIYMINRCIP
jgi:hypothetical protein